MRSLTRSVVALCLILAACSPAAEPTTTSSTTTSTTSTTLPPTTTTSTLPGDLSPINGLPLADPALAQRRLLAVKIDNHPRATPQSGVEQADAVIEVMVEGITRFLTLWLESDSEYLGPMRSGRPTDGSLLAYFNQPVFARSGAQDWVHNYVAARDVNQIGEIGGDATFRISSKSAPHNLYVDTIALREVADTRGYPDEAPAPLWAFGDMPATASPASHVRMVFGGNVVEWDWDETEGVWLRTAYGSDSMWVTQDGETGRFSTPVLVALYVEQYTAVPEGGQAGTAVPASRTVGTGKAFVFADGKVIEGTWERPDETSWFSIEDSSGNPVAIPAGRPWISLVPDNGGLSYEP